MTTASKPGVPLAMWSPALAVSVPSLLEAHVTCVRQWKEGVCVCVCVCVTVCLCLCVSHNYYDDNYNNGYIHAYTNINFVLSRHSHYMQP